MTDEDRTLGADVCAERMDVGDEVVPRRRWAGRLAVPGEVGGDAPDAVAEALDDRAPGPAVERESVEEDDGYADTVLLVGEGWVVDGQRHRNFLPVKAF